MFRHVGHFSRSSRLVWRSHWNRNASAVRNGGASLHSPTIAEMTSSSLRVKVKKCGVVAKAGQTSARLKTATRGMPSGVRTDAGSLILRFNASRSRDEPREGSTLPLARLPHPQMPTERRFRAECLETNNTLGSLTHCIFFRKFHTSM